MSKYQQVEDQVKEAIANGSDTESIKQSLLSGGYSETDIAKIVLDAQTSTKKDETLKFITKTLWIVAICAGILLFAWRNTELPYMF